VARMAQRVAVMYSGKIVELSDARSLYAKPLHPYTRGLLDSIPTLGEKARLDSIPGIVPSIFNLPQGCRFHPRCPEAYRKCSLMLPPLFEPEPGRQVRCWLYEE